MAHIIYTPDEIDAVMAHYAETPTAELAARIGSTKERLYRVAKLLGMRKDPKLIEDMARERMTATHPARSSQFQKGIVPHNKGIRRPGFAAGRMAETQFKKGQKNFNEMPMWSLRWIGSSTGSKAKYLHMKVDNQRYVPYTVNWRPLHQLYWEMLRGPIPPGHALVFRDGDPENIRLGNLELLSRADLMRRNTIHNLPEELKEVIRLKGSIKRVITCKRRRENAEEQDHRPA